MDSWWICLFLFCITFWTEWFLRKLKIVNFDQRYVLITGCDSGFGNRLAKRLDALRFHVFAACLTSEAVLQLTEECSAKMTAVELDVTKDASIEKMMEKVKRKLPRDTGLWAVVNNAGIMKSEGLSTWQTRQDYEIVLSVNLLGAALVTNACFPLVLKERGRVVNTSSVAGRLAIGNVTYAVSKYGVEAFSDILRRENYRNGVKVCIVEPGAFKTAILDKDKQLQHLEEKVNSLPDDVKKNLRDDYISMKMGTFMKGTSMASTNIDAVVDAYIHAITAKYPRKRYLVGMDARFFIRPLWMLPEIVSDFVVNKLIGKDIYKT